MFDIISKCLNANGVLSHIGFTFVIIKCNDVNIKCNKNIFEYYQGNERLYSTAYNVGKNCVVQLTKLCPFQRDDSLKLLFVLNIKRRGQEISSISG